MNLIVLADRHWGIGKDGNQLCYIPEDLKHFKRLTSNHAVILGRKTLATFPGGKPLKGRRNMILSGNPNFYVDGAEVYRDLDELLRAAPEDAFVIGGGTVYRQLLSYCNIAYVTRLECVYDADAFFPNLAIDPAWEYVSGEPAGVHDGVWFHYDTYKRKCGGIE